MDRSGRQDTASNRVGYVVRRGIGIPVTAALVLLLLAPGVASASTPTTARFQTASHSARNGTATDVVTLNSKTCTALGAGAGCTLTISTVVTPAAATGATGGGIAPMSVTGGCITFDATLNYGWLGLTLMSDRISVPMCWQGSTSWSNGRVDAYVYPPPGYSFNVDWFGMVNDHTTSTQAGDNWHISSAWSTTYFWARVNFRGNSCMFGLCGLGYYWTGG